MATCETCRFCGRAIWPYAEDVDWCGSYEADPAKAEQEEAV